MPIKFGSAGNPDSFYQQGHKSSLDMPRWLAEMGLNAYEYQCSRGVRIKEEFARKLGEAARAANVALSIHAPYYINLSTEDPEIKQRTKGHIMKSLRAADWMGASVVVMHPGGGSGKNRLENFKRGFNCLKEICREIEAEGLSHIKLAPETMGKINQLGSLDEVLELCTAADFVVPCVDFGHLHAVSLGGLTEKDAFEKILQKIAAALGREALQNLHIHFSPIEFTKGGEKKHRTVPETEFGPDFTPLAELICEYQLTPAVICESQGRQAEDALIYRQIYRQIKEAADSVQ